MNDHALFDRPGISPQLRLAFKKEFAKPDYDALRADATVMLRVAINVRTNTPAAFDLRNPVDNLIWIFAGRDA